MLSAYQTSFQSTIYSYTSSESVKLLNTLASRRFQGFSQKNSRGFAHT